MRTSTKYLSSKSSNTYKKGIITKYWNLLTYTAKCARHKIRTKLSRISHDLITNRAAHVIRAKNFTLFSYHFRFKFARNIFRMWWGIFKQFLHVKFTICMKYHVLITWIWCEKIEHQIDIKIFSCENDTKKYCMDFVCIFHAKFDMKKILHEFHM